MAHIIQFIHGSTTIDVSAGDYGVLDFSPRAGMINQETVQDSMKVYVTGSDADDLQTNLQSLVHALEVANRRKNVQAGDRLWLHITPYGYDNAYRTEILEGTIDLPDDALQGRWANLAIDVTVNFVRKNFWEDTADTWLSMSNDVPVTWTERRPAGDKDLSWGAVASDADGTNLIAATYGGRLWTSVDGGANWTERRPAGDAGKNWQCVASDNDGSVLIAGVGGIGGRLYKSVNSGVDWAEVQPAGDADKSWRVAASDGDGSVLVAGVEGGRLYLSVDTGANWSEMQPAGAADKVWYTAALDSDGSVIFVGVAGGRLYLSINSGSTWTEVQPAGDANKGWRLVTVDSDGSNLAACVYGGRVYTSSDSGSTWVERQPAGDANKDWLGLAGDGDGSNLIVGLSTGRLYTSNDGGANWTERQPAGDADGDWRSLAMDSDGSNLIAADYGGRIWTSANAQPTTVALSNAGTTYNNWAEFPVQTGFDLPCPIELHLSTLNAIISRLYAGVFDCQNLMTDFDHFFEVGDFTTTTGTKTADATCSGGQKMAFSLTDATVESAYAVFQSTIAKLNQVQGKRLRPFLRWADTTDIANVQVRLRLTIGTTTIYVTNWVTPATYKLQELPILAVPKIASEAVTTHAPQVRLYVDVKRTTANTEDVAIDFITFLPADNMSVLDQGAALVCDPSASAYELFDLPYDEDAESLLYNGTNFCGTWTRLGASPLMLYPNQAGTLVFCWRDDDGANSAIAEIIGLTEVTYRKRRLSL